MILHSSRVFILKTSSNLLANHQCRGSKDQVQVIKVMIAFKLNPSCLRCLNDNMILLLLRLLIMNLLDKLYFFYLKNHYKNMYFFLSQFTLLKQTMLILFLISFLTFLSTIVYSFFDCYLCFVFF